MRVAFGFRFVIGLCFIAAPVAAQQPILEGLDLLETRIGDSFEDLSELDLLCPGCFVIGDPVIPFGGVPLDSVPGCPGPGLGELGGTDTIVRRLTSTPPLFPDQPQHVDIQIVELNLQSVEPFQVNCQGEEQLWMLDVSVNPNQQQPLGGMMITKVHPNGGFFEAMLPVVPVLTFTRVDDAPQVVCIQEPPVINFQFSHSPWAEQVPSEYVEIPGCTSNFFPGVDPENGDPVGCNMQGQVNGKPIIIKVTAARDEPTGVGTAPAGPLFTVLHQNIPNPFNPMTTIRFDLASEGHVSLRILDVTGRVVRTLVEGSMAAGARSLVWNGLDDMGHDTASGVYFYRLQSEDLVTTRKMVVAR